MIGACGAFFCFMAVVLGAWLSHGAVLSASAEASAEIAVRYQFWHGLALLMLTVLPIVNRARRHIALLLALGTLGFCGSIYGLSFWEWRPLWWLTPAGGVLLMLAWLYLLWTFLYERNA